MPDHQNRHWSLPSGNSQQVSASVTKSWRFYVRKNNIYINDLYIYIKLYIYKKHGVTYAKSCALKWRFTIFSQNLKPKSCRGTKTCRAVALYGCTQLYDSKFNPWHWLELPANVVPEHRAIRKYWPQWIAQKTKTKWKKNLQTIISNCLVGYMRYL